MLIKGGINPTNQLQYSGEKNMEEKMPLIGDQFPMIDVQTTQGPIRLPDAYIGKWLILFSHPADFTPVCTTEFVAFQKRYNEFKKHNTELIGLSIDQVFSHIKWIDWIQDNLNTKIEFPIIADTGRVANILGLIHPNKGSSTVRAVFIIDPKSIIRAILYYPQELGRNMDEFIRMIKGFQLADKEGVAIPANWPQNELIQDKIIIPPAKDVKTAEKRRKEHDCYDWWFCYRAQK